MSWRVELTAIGGIRFGNLALDTLIEGVYDSREDAERIARDVIGKPRSYSVHSGTRVGMVVSAFVEGEP